MFDIIEAYEKYENEFNYELEKQDKSFAGMFQKFESKVLYSLIRSVKPSNMLELGCYHGFTSQIIIKAIKKNNVSSVLLSSDLLGNSNHMDYDDGVTSRTLVHGDSMVTLPKIVEPGIDFLFIDSCHTYDFAKWYCDILVPKVKKDCFVFIHDWEGIEGDNDGEFKSVIENAVEPGLLSRVINLMEHTRKNRHLSSTPDNIEYAKGDRNPSEILVRL